MNDSTCFLGHFYYNKPNVSRSSLGIFVCLTPGKKGALEESICMNLLLFSDCVNNRSFEISNQPFDG